MMRLIPTQPGSSVPAGVDQIPSHLSDVFLFVFYLSPISLREAQVEPRFLSVRDAGLTLVSNTIGL